MGGDATTGGSAGSRRSLLAGLAGAVRDGKLLAVEVVEESLRRIGAAEELNAVVALRSAGALEDAARLDEAIRRGTDQVGPLAGLPLLVKDIEAAAGLPTTYGSLTHAERGPVPRDGVVAGRLREAGAIVVGKTNVPEFAFEGYTANRVFGPTRNPWAPALSPGGSSGGSAAALAAGLAPLATATDVGGSIRIPAALCGLVGLKPTAGLIGRDPALASLELNNHGPLTATVADARLLLELLRGPAIGDPGSLPVWSPAQRPLPSRILVVDRLADGPALSDAVAGTFAAAVEALSRAVGASIERVAPSTVFPGGYDAHDWFRIVGFEQAHALGRETIERERDRFDPVFHRSMVAALEVTADEHAAARRRRLRYVAELDRLLGDESILATPTLTVEGWSAEGVLAGRHEPGLPGTVYNTEPPNLTGHPAISLPAGMLPNGLPFGLQLLGPRFGDWLLLDVAAVWEATRPWPLVAPGYRPFAEAAIEASTADRGR
jgi:Asp-tRNA(Asn)/Glu-tRNA(Gln) amidotransferase A subunit family amidase